MKMRIMVNRLRSLSKPDEEYLAVVEDLITKQYQVATWDTGANEFDQIHESPFDAS
ncbi:MAG TPA: hypothetical protein VFZ08_11335 [Terriglobia bacterium]|nr:hypothetical protein [Terriglobia bacterium]